MFLNGKIIILCKPCSGSEKAEISCFIFLCNIEMSIYHILNDHWSHVVLDGLAKAYLEPKK